MVHRISHLVFGGKSLLLIDSHYLVRYRIAYAEED